MGDRHQEQQGEIETESLETENDPVAIAELTSTNGCDDYQIDKFSVMTIAEAFEIKSTANLSEDDLSGHSVKLKTKTGDLFTIADSGSPMSFLNNKTARRLQQNDKSALFKCIPLQDTARYLACCNGETITPKERLIITVGSGCWKKQAAPLIRNETNSRKTKTKRIE